MGSRLENTIAGPGNGRAIAPSFSSETNRQRRSFDKEREL